MADNLGVRPMMIIVSIRKFTEKWHYLTGYPK